jgi:hypothetical protein
LWVTILDNTSTLAEGQNNGKLKQGTASTYDTINIPSGGTIDFGDIYSTAANVKDLTFSFSEADPTNGGNPVTGSTYNGVVTYVGVPEPTTLERQAWTPVQFSMGIAVEAFWRTKIGGALTTKIDDNFL